MVSEFPSALANNVTSEDVISNGVAGLSTDSKVGCGNARVTDCDMKSTIANSETRKGEDAAILDK